MVLLTGEVWTLTVSIYNENFDKRVVLLTLPNWENPKGCKRYMVVTIVRPCTLFPFISYLL